MVIGMRSRVGEACEQLLIKGLLKVCVTGAGMH